MGFDDYYILKVLRNGSHAHISSMISSFSMNEYRVFRRFSPLPPLVEPIVKVVLVSSPLRVSSPPSSPSPWFAYLFAFFLLKMRFYLVGKYLPLPIAGNGHAHRDA